MIKTIQRKGNTMKTNILILGIALLLTGCTHDAAPAIQTKHQLTDTTKINAIINGAAKDGWKQYHPDKQCQCNDKTLYFKKRVTQKDYFIYSHNRGRQTLNRYMTVYAKVTYTQQDIIVQFVDQVGMNMGRLGINSKIENVLSELQEAITSHLQRLG